VKVSAGKKTEEIGLEKRLVRRLGMKGGVQVECLEARQGND
jgi:hypothetical protein